MVDLRIADRSADGGSRAQLSLVGSPDEDRTPEGYALYRQCSSSAQVGADDVLLGIFDSCDAALDASDADVIAQLAAVGGFRCEVAHLLTPYPATGDTSTYPVVTSVGGWRVLSGDDLETALLDIERWLRSQRLD